MAKLINRMTAAEARAKANDLNALIDRVYEDIKYSAENNRFFTWFYFGDLKKEMVIEVIKNLRKSGYEVELFEEEEKEVNEKVDRPRGDEVLNILLGIKAENKEESEEVEPANTYVWRDIRISWK